MSLSVDSSSVGDPARFRALADLEQMIIGMPEAPADQGQVTLVVRRVAGGLRETPDRVALSPEAGVPGDAWGRKESPNLEAQLAVMQREVAERIANGQPLTLFGDNLFLDLDLSARALPAGSRVRVGAAVLEVTPKPHNGCKKFLARFGDGALRLVLKPEIRHRNLRGIYMRVIEAGEVRPGDAAVVISRSPAAFHQG